MSEIYSHDEQKNINLGYSKMAVIKCKYCGAIRKKYVESHYTGGKPCVLFAKYCKCGKELQ